MVEEKELTEYRERDVVRHIQQRLFDALPRYPRCADESWIQHRCKKNDAPNYKHIQLNSKNRKQFLAFDVDKAGAAFAWEDGRLATPTVMIVNPANGHAHLVYQLIDAVFFDPRHDCFARHGPYNLFKLIKNAYQSALRADPAYPGLLVKNPFHPAWRVIWTDRCYTLEELANEYPGDLSLYTGAARLAGSYGRNVLIDAGRVSEGRRNVTLFERARRFAYGLARKAQDDSEIFLELREFCSAQNRGRVCDRVPRFVPIRYLPASGEPSPALRSLVTALFFGSTDGLGSINTPL